MIEAIGPTLVCRAQSRASPSCIAGCSTPRPHRSSQPWTGADHSAELAPAARRQHRRVPVPREGVPDRVGDRPVRILSFTGGAGNMYCGSCLRDNALASALHRPRARRRPGRRSTRRPRTDERNVSHGRRCGSAASASFSSSTRQSSAARRSSSRIVSGSADWVIKMASKRRIKVDSAEPRGDDGVDAARRAGLPAQGSGQAAPTGWKSEPRFDVHQPPRTRCCWDSPVRCERAPRRHRCAARCRERTCSSTGLRRAVARAGTGADSLGAARTWTPSSR